MNNRDDFTNDTKKELAQRTGYRCSFPGCTNVTIGPSDESHSSASCTGMACHIAAAAGGAGAKRYDEKMSREVRRSVNNGIWMCYTHGKIIDTDEKRFTVQMLKMWKEIAERRAKFVQENGSSLNLPSAALNDLLLAPNHVVILDECSINLIVGQALCDSGINLLWGGKTSEMR